MEQNKLLGRLYLNLIKGLNALDRICLDDILNGEILPSCFSRTLVEKFVQKKLEPATWTPDVWLQMAQYQQTYYEKHGIQVLSFFDESYPSLLRETARPPYILFVRGNISILNTNCLTIVGTRYPTGLGLETAQCIAKSAVQHGFTVVSGLARGIDTASHAGAVQGDGYTIAVLGSGIDYIYPAGNKGIAEKILATGGAIISEYPCGMKPGKYTFPERNRILAGLSYATVVIEAPLGSGALITADYAIEEGRDVFVSARCINSIRSEGCRKLQEDGASPLDSIEEILKQYNETTLFI